MAEPDKDRSGIDAKTGIATNYCHAGDLANMMTVGIEYNLQSPPNPAPSPRPDGKPLSFTDLPGEIRNKIYGYTMPVSSVIELRHRLNDHTTKELDAKEFCALFTANLSPLKTPGLLRVSTQISYETAILFYATNEFVGTWAWLAGFLMTIGSSNIRLLTKVIIYPSIFSLSTHSDSYISVCTPCRWDGEILRFIFPQCLDRKETVACLNDCF